MRNAVRGRPGPSGARPALMRNAVWGRPGPHRSGPASTCVPMCRKIVSTVAILAQGTHWAVAATAVGRGLPSRSDAQNRGLPSRAGMCLSSWGVFLQGFLGRGLPSRPGAQVPGLPSRPIQVFSWKAGSPGSRARTRGPRGGPDRQTETDNTDRPGSGSTNQQAWRSGPRLA